MEAGLPTEVTRRVDPPGRYGLRIALLGVSFVLVTVPFAILLFEVLAKGPLTRLDASVANWMNGWVHGSPWLVHTLEIVSDFLVPLWLGMMVAARWAVVRDRSRSVWRSASSLPSERRACCSVCISSPTSSVATCSASRGCSRRPQCSRSGELKEGKPHADVLAEGVEPDAGPALRGDEKQPARSR